MSHSEDEGPEPVKGSGYSADESAASPEAQTKQHQCGDDDSRRPSLSNLVGQSDQQARHQAFPVLRSGLGRLSRSFPPMRTSSLVVTSHYACWHNDTVPRRHASSSLVWSVQCTGEGSMDAGMLCSSRKVALASGQSSRRRHRLSPRWTQLPRFPQPQLLPERSRQARPVLSRCLVRLRLVSSCNSVRLSSFLSHRYLVRLSSGLERPSVFLTLSTASLACLTTWNLSTIRRAWGRCSRMRRIHASNPPDRHHLTPESPTTNSERPQIS